MSSRSNTAKLTQGSILQSICFLALPAMASMFSQVIFDLTDVYWVSKSGPESLAAFTAGSFLIWSIFSLGALVSTGVTAIIARRIGENNESIARYVASQSLIVSLICALITTLIFYLLIPSIVTFLKLSSEVEIKVYPYLQIFISGTYSIFLFSTIDAVFRGVGDTKTPMIIVMVSLLINMVLDPLLIFGWGGFPRLDVGGAALGTVIARSIGIVLGIALLLKHQWLDLSEAFRSLDLKLAKQSIGIGAPHAFTGFLFCIIYLALARIVGEFGTEPLAAMGLGQRIEAIVFFTLMGFSVACTTLVGQNLGAKQPNRAEKAVWYTLILSIIFMLIYMIVYLSFSQQIVKLFVSNPLIILWGIAYLQIISWSLPLFAFELVLEGAFAGAGNTLPPMIIITTGTLIRIPLAHYLANQLSWGVSGIFWAISFSIMLKGAIMVLWFKRGNWKDKQV